MGAAPTFVGSVPEIYDRYLARLVLEPFARDVVSRIPTQGLGSVLELACGTGLLTEKLRKALSPDTRLVATDFSPDMLEIARAKPGLQSGVQFQTADATDLPFGDAEFDFVVVQFGFMFFPDKSKAAAEIFRVLRPGGRLLFTVWDELQYHQVSKVVHDHIEKMFEGNPPTFYHLPFAYFNQNEIRLNLRENGFVDVAVTKVEKKLAGPAKDFATAFVQGNPIVAELENLGADLEKVTAEVQNVIAAKMKRHPEGITATARALVVGGRKPFAAGASTPVPVPEAKAAANPNSATETAKRARPGRKRKLGSEPSTA